MTPTLIRQRPRRFTRRPRDDEAIVVLASSWPIRWSRHGSFYKRNYFCAAFNIGYLAERPDEPPAFVGSDSLLLVLANAPVSEANNVKVRHHRFALANN